MATLKSDHFTRLRGDLDAATAGKLENCANGVPTQVQSHFALTANSRGEAVRKLQEALVAIQKTDASLKLRKFSVTGVYDRDFANAVEDYKRARGIKNFANAIDNVVGVKTIIAMDGDLPGGSPDNPPEDNRTKADVVIRLEGNRTEGRMTGAKVLPSGRHLQVYSPVPSDKILFNETSQRFLILDGWFLHDTGDKPRGMLDQSLVFASLAAAQSGARIDRVYFYGSSAGGRSVLDLAGLARRRLGTLTMIGVVDAHFTQEDTVDKPTGRADEAGFIAKPDNIPAFSTFSSTDTTPPGQRFNWFQTAGNHGQKRGGIGDPVFTSNFDGEIHGTVAGYANLPLSVSAAAEFDDVRAHEEACTRGLVIMENKIIISLLTP